METLKLISEEIQDVEYITEQKDNGNKNYKIKGIMMISQRVFNVIRRREFSYFVFLQKSKYLNTLSSFTETLWIRLDQELCVKKKCISQIFLLLPKPLCVNVLNINTKLCAQGFSWKQFFGEIHFFDGYRIFLHKLTNYFSQVYGHKFDQKSH